MSIAILGFVWVLWPILAIPGGLAFGVLAGVAAIAAAPIALRSFRPRIYMLGLLAFFAFAAASSAWSPLHQPLLDIDPAKGEMNVRSEVLRIAPLFLAIGVLYALAMRMDERQRARVTAIAKWALLAQLVIVGVFTVFELQILDMLRPIVPDTGEGVQNLTRNCLIMVAAAPALIAALSGLRTARSIIIAAVVVSAAELAILIGRGVDAGIIALPAAAICIGVTRLFPRYGFRLLAIPIVIGLLASPLIFGVMSRGVKAETAMTSSQQRLAIWSKAIEVIDAHPVIGGGVGVLRTMDEQIKEGPRAGQYYMPNHPHNMALQLWAETGAVGAVLASIAVLLAAWRLPAPRDLGKSAFHVAGLIGVSVPIVFVSFDLWNPWWWAVPGLLGILAITAPRDAANAAGASA